MCLVGANNFLEFGLRRGNRLDAKRVHAEIETLNDQFRVRRRRGVDEADLCVMLLTRLRNRPVNAVGESRGDVAFQGLHALLGRFEVYIHTSDGANPLQLISACSRP